MIALRYILIASIGVGATEAVDAFPTPEQLQELLKLLIELGIGIVTIIKLIKEWKKKRK